MLPSIWVYSLDQMSMCVSVRASVLVEILPRGDVALLSNANLSASGAPWYLHNLWANGHVGVVRSVLWDDQVRIPLAPIHTQRG